MWGTDLTFTTTEEDGSVAVFIAVEHFNSACVGIHASIEANRFEALEPIRQGIRDRFGNYLEGTAEGLKVRHDHGSQYVSDFFQSELKFLGIKSSPSFVRSPEGNGISERFIRTLKEQLLWIRRFKNVEELRKALQEFRRIYNEQWMVQRHRFLSPNRIQEEYLANQMAA
jgi:transposase InsO family protein